MAKITGIGGVFFTSKGGGAALAAWYREHLGLALEGFGGAILKWPDDMAEDRGLTVWHVADKDSQWFSPSGSSFMINYRVDNLGEMLAQLRAGGVEIVGGPESHAAQVASSPTSQDALRPATWKAATARRRLRTRSSSSRSIAKSARTTNSSLRPRMPRLV